MPVVVSLCDKTGNMVRPWIEAGHHAFTVDIQRAPAEAGRTHVVADVSKLNNDFIAQLNPIAIFAFPPCTHLAASGARWFKDKGLAALIDGLRLVEACRALCEASGAKWMLENPIGSLSTYWRKPDATFDPCDFGKYLTPPGDAYTKRTCLWYGGGLCYASP